MSANRAEIFPCNGLLSHGSPTSFPGSLILTPGALGVKMRDPGNEVDGSHVVPGDGKGFVLPRITLVPSF